MATPAAVLNIIVTANNTQATGALTATQAQLKRTAAVADASTARVSRSASAAGARLATFGKVTAVGLGAAAVASTKLAIDFERGMRNVNSIAQLPERQFKKLSKEVLDLAGRTAQAPQTLAEGLYDLVSSGFDARESMEILGKSARAATAGLTDTATSTKAVAAVLNAYRLDAKDAGDVSDILFRTVDRGVISFEELASNIGMVLPAASALDVDLAQVGASIATLTKQGQSGSSAVVNLNQAMTALFKPSEAMKTALNSLGVESAVALTKTEGLQGALEAVIGATDGSKEAIGELFPNVRALRAVFGLTGKNAAQAAEDIAGMQDATGATARALSQQSKSLAFQWQKFTAELKASAIRIGQDVIPELQSLLSIVTDKKLDPSEKVAMLGEKLTEAIKRWLPKIAEAGAAVGLALIKGIADAFIHSSLIGKLFIGAGLIRLIGGKGALLGAGKKLGGWLIGGITTAFRTGAGILGGLTSVLKRSAILAVGVFIGEGILDGIANSIDRGSDDLRTALDAIADPGFWDTKIHVGFDGVQIGVGEDEANRLREIVDTIESGVRPTAAMRAEARGLADDLGLSSEASKALNGVLRRGVSRIDVYREAVKRQAHAQQVLTQTSKDVRVTRRKEEATTEAVKRAEDHLGDVRRKFGRHSKEFAQAERAVAKAKERDAGASRELRKAEKLHGAQREIAKAVAKDSIRVERERIVALQKEKQRVEQAMQAWAKHGGSIKEAERLDRRYAEITKQLDAAQRKKKQTLLEVSQTIGSNYTRKLKGMSDAELGVQKQSKRAESAIKGFSQQLEPATRNLNRGAREAKQFGDGFSNASVTAYRGMVNIARNVTNMSKGLDGDAPTFNLQSPKGGGKGPGQRPGAQTGWHVPGSGAGDKVPAMLEPGEFVLNRKAVETVGAANLERLNFDVAPRFAAGGIVALGKQLQSEGYEVGENPAFGGVDPVHVAGSYHYSGQALDVNDDVAPFAVGGGETASLTALYNRLKRMAGVIELLWQVPNHYDHLHVAMAEGANGRLAGVGGQLAQIERQIVGGPDGALKDMAQGAIDMTREMANDYLKSFGGSTGGYGGSGTYNVQTLEQLWTAVNRGLADAHIMAAIAMGESGGNPRAMGHDPGGTTGLGLWQVTTGYNDATIAKYGGVNAMLKPVPNAKAAGDIFRSQGYGAWVVYNEGIYQRWMKNGGLVQMLQKGGGGKGGKNDGRDDMNLTVTGGGPGGSAMNIFSPDLPGVGGYGYAGGPTTPPGQYAPAVDALPNVQAVMDAIWRAENNDGRRKVLDGALGQLRAWGLAADKMKQIEDLTLAADTYGAWADRASATVDDDALPGSGVLNGATEVEHLTNQLTRLFELRNALIDAERVLDQKVREMVAFIAKVKAKIDDIRKRIDQVAKQRKRIVEDIQKLRDDKKRDEDDVKKWEGKLAEELKRKPKDQDQGRIKDLREKIWGGRARIANAPRKIADKQRELDKLDREQAKRDWQLNTALEQMRTTSEDDRLSELVGQQEDLRSRLQTVQDLGSPMENIPLAQAAAMPFGTFGGQIFDAQQRLRDIAAARSEVTDPEKVEPLHIADLLEFAQAVSLGVFRRKGGLIPAYAMGGYHAAGGLALVGERGPELATLPAGTRVHSNQDSRAMFSPTIYADIYIGGEKIAEHVAVKTRESDNATLSRFRAGAVRR